MLCMTLMLTEAIAANKAQKTIDQLVTSLNQHPNALGGEVARFHECGTRQVQRCLASTDETVGFILSAARCGAWAVDLTMVPESRLPVFIDQSQSFTEDRILRQAQANAKSAPRAPGGVRVGAVVEGRLVQGHAERAVGHIAPGLKRVSAIERAQSLRVQEAR